MTSAENIAIKTVHGGIARRSRAMTATKSTKTCAARAKFKFVFHNLLNLFTLLAFSLPSPSSLVKLPNTRKEGVCTIRFPPN